MRKLILLLIVIFVALVAIYRDRLFLRDPLGKVERNGAPVADGRVFINYANDVLLQERNDTRMVVVQNWSRTPVTPPRLTCIEGLACLTPADRLVDAQATPMSPAQQATMSSLEVLFTDLDGSRVHVTLR